MTNTASFITTKTGTSKDKVQVKVLFAFDYKTIIENDLAKAKSFTPDQIFQLAQEKNISCTLQDCEDALTGTKHGRTGLITSLQGSLTDDPNKTPTYDNHPTISGVKVSIKSGDLYCTGLLLEETILEKDPTPEIKKPVNSGVVVQLKNMISKIAKFEKDKIRTYKLDNLDSYQIIQAFFTMLTYLAGFTYTNKDCTSFFTFKHDLDLITLNIDIKKVINNQIPFSDFLHSLPNTNKKQKEYLIHFINIYLDQVQSFLSQIQLSLLDLAFSQVQFSLLQKCSIKDYS